MPTDNKIQDFHIVTFTKTTEMMLQQSKAVFEGHVMTKSCSGDKAQEVLQFGEVEMEDFNAGTNPGQWLGDTKWSEIDHYQRWMFPQSFVKSLPVSKQNILRMLTDPKSSYAEAIKMAYKRKYDDVVIKAALGTGKVGKYEDLKDEAFPESQKIAHGDSGLTLDKLLVAREMLKASHIDPSEELYIVTSEQQITNMLSETKVQSSDYNTVKALVNGEINTFAGFTFLQSERLSSTAGASGKGATRHCFAYAKSGLHVGIWDDFNIKVDERPDKNYAWQIYATASIGAVRTQEKKVIQIDCQERVVPAATPETPETP